LTLVERVSRMDPGEGTQVVNLVSWASAVLLPLNLALFCMLKERGMLTLHGIFRTTLVSLQSLAVWILFNHQQIQVPASLGSLIHVHAPFLGPVSIPVPAMGAFSFAFIVCSIAYFRNRDPLIKGFLWAVVTSFFALAASRNFISSSMYLGTSGLILVTSVIESSYRMAFRDELTGLPARRALNEALLKLGKRYSLAMIDIDFFKKFNDQYGHPVGDQVLRMVASRLAGVNGGGRAFRYGGEEFTLLFAGKPAEDVLPHLEHLRKTIESSPFFIRSRNRPRKKPKNPVAGSTEKAGVTISIGVADRSKAHTTPQQVIKAADEALYNAKNGGRNRVEIYRPAVVDSGPRT